jgi:hypothetical protein
VLLDFGRFELQSSLLTDFPVHIQAPSNLRLRRKNCLISSVVDPQWFQCRSGSSIFCQCDPDPWFSRKKLERKKPTNENFFFGPKIAFYLSLGLHKECLRYRKSLRTSIENIQHLNTRNFFIFVSHFFSQGSRSSRPK